MAMLDVSGLLKGGNERKVYLKITKMKESGCGSVAENPWNLSGFANAGSAAKCLAAPITEAISTPQRLRCMTTGDHHFARKSNMFMCCDRCDIGCQLES